MQRKVWINLFLFLVIPGLLFTVSCAKKAVKPDVSLTQKAAEAEAARLAAQKAKEDEIAKQRAIKEERLAEENARIVAKEKFLSEDIHFEFDKSSLLPGAQDILSDKAKWIRDNPDVSVIIEGHCDERGTIEYNLALGDRRAESARAFLIDLGVLSTRLKTISYGEERPADQSHNKKAWAENRRAHFVIE